MNPEEKRNYCRSQRPLQLVRFILNDASCKKSLNCVVATSGSVCFGFCVSFYKMIVVLSLFISIILPLTQIECIVGISDSYFTSKSY